MKKHKHDEYISKEELWRSLQWLGLLLVLIALGAGVVITALNLEEDNCTKSYHNNATNDHHTDCPGSVHWALGILAFVIVGIGVVALLVFFRMINVI